MNILAVEWTPEGLVIVIGAAATAIVSIITALKASGKANLANAKADIANDRVSNVSRAQDTMRSDLTQVASNTPPPAPAAIAQTATAVPVKLVDASPDAVVSTVDKPSLVNPGIHHPLPGGSAISTLPYQDKPKG